MLILDLVVALRKQIPGLGTRKLYLKTDFRLHQVFTSFEEAAQAMERSIHNYNHLRPPVSCDYLTPAVAHSKDQPLKKHWKPKRYNSQRAPPKSS